MTPEELKFIFTELERLGNDKHEVWNELKRLNRLTGWLVKELEDLKWRIEQIEEDLGKAEKLPDTMRNADLL